MEPSMDIVDVLSEEHAALRSVAASIGVAGGATGVFREDAWVAYLELSDRVVRHEIAEELVVFPLLPAGPEGAAAGRSPLEDHSTFEHLLELLDREEFGSSVFAREQMRLIRELMEHLDMEETRVFPMISARLGRGRRIELAHQFRRVVRSAPPVSGSSRARIPHRPTIVARTSALAVWMRDVAHSTGVAR